MNNPNAIRLAQNIVLGELYNVLSELEEKINPRSSHGKGQLYIIRRIIEEMDLKGYAP